jgi:hypothetical protein
MIRRIDELYLEHPELGARRMSRWPRGPSCESAADVPVDDAYGFGNLQEATDQDPPIVWSVSVARAPVKNLLKISRKLKLWAQGH